MQYPSYTSLQGKVPGDTLTLNNTDYLFLCREELPDGEFCLLESFNSSRSEIILVRKDGTRSFRKLPKNTSKRPKNNPVSIEKALDAGEDIAAKALGTAPLHMPNVEGILPEMDEHAYIPLGHPAVDVTVSVDRMGNIWDQCRFYDRNHYPGETIIYDPRVFAGITAAAQPEQALLDGIYPILINVHRTDTEILESMYLMEVGDLRLAPAVWVRNVYISLPQKKVTRIEYRSVGAEACNFTNECEVLAERFYDCLAGLIYGCDDFLSHSAQISIPDKKLERSYYGTQLSIANLFNGPQAHYGHRFYGLANHNFFPPNYITAILAYTLSNQLDRAGILAHYLLSFAVDPFGRLLYRQGYLQAYGFSASEIGQLLWVISRYHRAAHGNSMISGCMDRVLAMCNYIISRIIPCETVPGAYVVRTCAEADTNERIADYLQNTAWSIRGLEAGASILGESSGNTDHVLDAAQRLRESFELICKKCTIDTHLGKLVPFCLQYSVLPWTMSRCNKTTVPVDPDALENYFTQVSERYTEFDWAQQDFRENRYSNYRYYPELLSSCMLTPEQEAPILTLREDYGGELLGMIRFNRWLDDWPAYNLAINYMERGHIDKYLLLLAAHARYHGLLDFHTYYEQVSFRNNHAYAKADTSAPSILLNNIMLNMMFCYETMDSDRIELLKGVPADWFDGKGFTVKDLRCSFGTVSIRANCHSITVTRRGSFPQTRLYLNAQNMDFSLPEGVTRSEDGYLLISPKLKHITLKLKNKN